MEQELSEAREGLTRQIAARAGGGMPQPEESSVEAAAIAERRREAEEQKAREHLRALLLAEKARREQKSHLCETAPQKAGEDSSLLGSPVEIAPPALPRPVALPAGGLLRGVPFDPDAPGRNARWEPAIPRLEVMPAPERLPAVDDQTEALLNAIIGECHFYMREVTFPSLCHAGTADDRIGWIGKAVQLAETGAKVGKAVARLRHGPDVKETRHTATIVQNRIDAAQGGGG